jgi:hypothetical protein
VKATRVTNVRAPVVLDASQSPWPIASADGIICINIVHISPWDATLGLIRGAAAILPLTAPFYLYDPYKREGFATTPSNQAFDRSLRYRNPTWGLRDLEAVAAIARSVGFSVPTITEMPANNERGLIETVRRRAAGELPPRATQILGHPRSDRSVPTIVGVGLFNLGLGVHDKGTARDDRLMQWLSNARCICGFRPPMTARYIR